MQCSGSGAYQACRTCVLDQQQSTPAQARSSCWLSWHRLLPLYCNKVGVLCFPSPTNARRISHKMCCRVSSQPARTYIPFAQGRCACSFDCCQPATLFLRACWTGCCFVHSTCVYHCVYVLFCRAFLHHIDYGWHGGSLADIEQPQQLTPKQVQATSAGSAISPAAATMQQSKRRC